MGLRLQWRAKSVDDVAHAAAQIMWRHAFADACFVAHSYGTFCVSRICQLHASLVHSTVRLAWRTLHAGLKKLGLSCHPSPACHACHQGSSEKKRSASHACMKSRHPLSFIWFGPSACPWSASSMAEQAVGTGLIWRWRTLGANFLHLTRPCGLACSGAGGPGVLPDVLPAAAVPLCVQGAGRGRGPGLATGLLNAARFLFSRDLIIAEVRPLAALQGF